MCMSEKWEDGKIMHALQKILKVQYVIFTDIVAVKIGTAVQIQNNGEYCFSFPLHPRLDAYVGCQIEEKNTIHSGRWQSLHSELIYPF